MDREFKRRLEALNRGPLREEPEENPEIAALRRKIRDRRTPAEPPAAVVYRRDLPHAEARSASPGAANRRPIPLHEAVAGEEIGHPQHGRAFAATSRASTLGKRAIDLETTFPCRFGAADSALIRSAAALCACETVLPQEVIFLDLETAGLTSAPLFLVGLLCWEDGRLVVRQYLARDYSEEAAVTALAAEHLTARKLLVTFNGKTFDLPFFRMRAAAVGVRFAPEPAHLDLLHACRRAWRHRLPDCKLQTLEQLVCGHVRTGDIPGSEVPDAYHEFVRTGDATDLARILNHNRHDLVTLAELFTILAAVAPE